MAPALPLALPQPKFRMPPSSRRCGPSKLEHMPKRVDWTAEEDAIILRMVNNEGKMWKRIAVWLPGRSHDAVRRRWVWLCDHEKWPCDNAPKRVEGCNEPHLSIGRKGIDDLLDQAADDEELIDLLDLDFSCPENWMPSEDVGVESTAEANDKACSHHTAQFQACNYISSAPEVKPDDRKRKQCNAHSPPGSTNPEVGTAPTRLVKAAKFSRFIYRRIDQLPPSHLQALLECAQSSPMNKPEGVTLALWRRLVERVEKEALG